MGRIILQEVEFYAYHGVFEEERKIGGKYLIDIELEFSFEASLETDNLKDTIDYGQVYVIMKHEMSISSNLIEHVAGRIVKSLFQQFEMLEYIKIKLSKVKPPVEGQIKSVIAVLEERRSS